MARIYKHYITYQSADDLSSLNTFFSNREGEYEDQEESEDPNNPWITQFFWTPDRLDEDEQKELYEHPHCFDWAFNRTELFQHSIGIQDRLLRVDLEQIFATHKQKAEIGDACLMIDFPTEEEYRGYAFWTKEELSDEIIDAISLLPGIYRMKLNQSVWTEGEDEDDRAGLRENHQCRGAILPCEKEGTIECTEGPCAPSTWWCDECFDHHHLGASDPQK